MAIKYVNESELKNQLGKGVQVVNFYADWCGPCKMMAPMFEELSNDVEVFKVNADNDRNLAVSMQVQGLPTTFVYKDGQLVNKVVGFAPKEAVMQNL